MANERMVPLLPCASIDEIRDFYLPLGFEVTYRQLKPNPYLALRRKGIDLHYYGLAGFNPEDSHSSCLLVTDATEPLFEAFAAGLRAQFGKLPLTGFPRITRPRRRKNAGNLSGFSLIDPAGNWIRVTAEASKVADGAPAARPSKLDRALADAVVFADSHGDVSQAITILSRALKRNAGEADVVERIEAETYLAELYVRAEEHARASDLLADIESLELSPADRRAAAGPLSAAAELRRALSP